MPTKEVIDNSGAKQKAVDRLTTGVTASGHSVFVGFDSIDTTTAPGADGSATALTAHPAGYLYITVAGVLMKVPFYNA